MSEQHQKESIKESIKGNEAEEFITKIVLKVIFSALVLVMGVGTAVYYTSGAG